MQYLFDAAQADPWILWGCRTAVIFLAFFIVWGLVARRHEIASALLFCWHVVVAAGQGAVEIVAPAFQRIAPLFGSRAIWGGLVMFIDLQARLNMPPEVVNMFTDIALALVGAFGLLLVGIGRIFAKGPIPLHKPQTWQPMTAAASQELLNRLQARSLGAAEASAPPVDVQPRPIESPEVHPGLAIPTVGPNAVSEAPTSVRKPPVIRKRKPTAKRKRRTLADA